MNNKTLKIGTASAVFAFCAGMALAAPGQHSAPLKQPAAAAQPAAVAPTVILSADKVTHEKLGYDYLGHVRAKTHLGLVTCDWVFADTSKPFTVFDGHVQVTTSKGVGYSCSSLTDNAPVVPYHVPPPHMSGPAKS